VEILVQIPTGGWVWDRGFAGMVAGIRKVGRRPAGCHSLRLRPREMSKRRRRWRIARASARMKIRRRWLMTIPGPTKRRSRQTIRFAQHKMILRSHNSIRYAARRGENDTPDRYSTAKRLHPKASVAAARTLDCWGFELVNRKAVAPLVGGNCVVLAHLATCDTVGDAEDVEFRLAKRANCRSCLSAIRRARVSARRITEMPNEQRKPYIFSVADRAHVARCR